jgi:glycosyltransferase involved in cell wall biosynthesis
MRVGLVVPGFSADASDWCIPALRHLARSLATRDDVRVISVRYPYQAARYQVDGADVIAVGGAVRSGPATLDVWRRTLGVLRDEHHRRPFDVLHAFWATESGLLASIAGRVLGIPTLVSLAGGELVGFADIAYGDQRIAWERLKIRASLRLASAVTAGSAYLQSIAERHVAPARLHRAPLGVDLDLFTPASSPSGSSPATPRARFVHVGTLTRVKDQGTLLRAFARLRQEVPCATLAIAGNGPLRGELERLAADLGVATAVHFYGEVDHARLADVVYGGASAFVLSSRHEAQGMVAIEAAACGLPVAGTRVGVIPELAASPDTVAPVGVVDALAAAMAATLEQSRDTVSRASARARSQFGLEACTNRFRALYEHLIAARSAEPTITDVRVSG